MTAATQGRKTCPLCAGAPDRFGLCARGHAPLRVAGVTWAYQDYRDNLLVDADAPVLAWRQDKGHRLGFENSHEALAWNVFRGLETVGGAAPVITALAGVPPPMRATEDARPELRFWARQHDGTPWPPFASARAALEEHLHGPDVNAAEPELVIVCPAARRVVFVDAHVAAPVAQQPPRWFATATRPAEQRRRRAIVDSMTHEEDALATPFRRGLAEVVKRGFYHQARRLLLARASARRLGDDWSACLVSVVNPPTMRLAVEHTTRFAGLLAPSVISAAGGAAYRALSWATLWAAVPEAARVAREGSAGRLRANLAEYVAARTVSRVPARLAG